MKPRYSIILGRLVRMRRELQNVQLSKMAEDMGLTTSGWSRVETGDTKMSVDQLYQACRILGFKPASIVQMADELMEVSNREMSRSQTLPPRPRHHPVQVAGARARYQRRGP